MTRVIEERSESVSRLRLRLLSSAHADGGWGYHAEKDPRIESTAWALIALSATSDSTSAEWPSLVAPHLRFLSGCQRSNGLLTETWNRPPNFASNGVAACALLHLAAGQTPMLPVLLRSLASVKGIQVVNAPEVRQDNHLQAWPWLPDTFSWIEPTCWCVLALKKSSVPMRPRTADARLAEAEAVLVDRTCEAGGWNYGNASALGQDLRPYVPTTSLGLMALQDRRTLPVVGRALARLDDTRLSEPSAMALSLACLALRLYGRPTDDVEQRLADDIERIERQGNLHSIAMALCALSGDRAVEAFRV